MHNAIPWGKDNFAMQYFVILLKNVTYGHKNNQ